MKYPETARRLQEALDEKHLSQQELADKSSVHKSSISQYLHGDHKPSNITSAKMGSILNVNPLWLMGFDVSKSPMNSHLAEDSPIVRTVMRNPDVFSQDIFREAVANHYFDPSDIKSVEIMRIYNLLSPELRDKLLSYAIDLAKIQEFESESKKRATA